MPQMTIPALIAGAVLLALVGIFAWLRQRKRLRANEIGELPTYLYLASRTQNAHSQTADNGVNGGAAASPNSGGVARGGNGGAAPFPLAADQGQAKAAMVGWAPTADETVQLLPGRLEPIPEGAGQEIRFVRGPGVTRVTFGRSRGPAYEHVQLRVASVSRMHAYMEFESGRWRIGRLSQTNGVLVNGTPIAADTAHTLDHGDRIEMGAAAFMFRQPSLSVRHEPVQQARERGVEDADDDS